ncbi:hypothetical protein LguiA_007782 [Lonicera macranthoides]
MAHWSVHRGSLDVSHAMKRKSWEMEQVAVNVALLLVEGAIFGGQSQDMSEIVNELYDILKDRRTSDYENIRPKRKTKRLHDPSPAPSTLAQAKAPQRKKSKK